MHTWRHGTAATPADPVIGLLCGAAYRFPRTHPHLSAPTRHWPRSAIPWPPPRCLQPRRCVPAGVRQACRSLSCPPRWPRAPAVLPPAPPCAHPYPPPGALFLAARPRGLSVLRPTPSLPPHPRGCSRSAVGCVCTSFPPPCATALACCSSLCALCPPCCFSPNFCLPRLPIALQRFARGSCPSPSWPTDWPDALITPLSTLGCATLLCLVPPSQPVDPQNTSTCHRSHWSCFRFDHLGMASLSHLPVALLPSWEPSYHPSI